MKKMVGIEALEPGAAGSVVTVGTFDGVHLGHRGLIMQTIDAARAAGADAVSVTWDRHPSQTLRPTETPPLLASPERKIELLETTGLDALVVIPFDEEFSHRSPEEFIDLVLVKGLGTKAVFVGSDWRFGHKARGDVALLTEVGAERGFDVHGVELQTIGGEAVTSSRVRSAIADGDLELARVLLGRPFDLDGMVVTGASRGKDLGFPTANLLVDPSLARPPLGVYAGIGRVAGEMRAAAISVGVNPTFGGEERSSPVSVEAFLLDFDRDIYGETFRLEFHKRLRDELKFDSVDALIAQMHKDVDETRALIGL